MRGPVHILIEKWREAEPGRRAARRSPEISLEHLLDTKRAFDSVAADYDGPIGNNALIQAMLAAPTREDFVAAVRALDRVLISGYYVVPLLYLPETWIARWNTVEHPEVTSLTGPRLETWWGKQ